jgi:hypothetical protein
MGYSKSFFQFATYFLLEDLHGLPKEKNYCFIVFENEKIYLGAHHKHLQHSLADKDFQIRRSVLRPIFETILK